jgi:large subunit ribosomal protein L12
MEYVYAALLLHKLKQNITEDSVKNVVKAAGVTPDDVRVKALVAALSEVQIDEALKAAPVAVAAAAAAAPTTAGGAGAAASGGGGRKEGRRSPRGSLVALWLDFFQSPLFFHFIFFLHSNNPYAIAMQDTIMIQECSLMILLPLLFSIVDEEF